MCNTREFVHPTNGNLTNMYSFSMEKTMGHFAVKYEKIKKHLAQRYVKENRGLILAMRK